VRGNRIKNIVDELAGERIDIVRYSDDMQVLIPNALQPAEVDEVILCKMMGRAIVLVLEDQLSLAIGRRGQNVRLASKLCKWDIEIMTREELEDQIERAVTAFSEIDGINDELAEMLVGEGFLSYDDLSVIEPDALMQMGDLSQEQVDAIVAVAEEKAEAAELAAAAERKRQRELEREQQAAEAAAIAQAEAAERQAPAGEDTAGEAPTGEAPAGEAPAGEDTAGEDTAGEDTAGEVTAGRATDAETATEPPADTEPADAGQVTDEAEEPGAGEDATAVDESAGEKKESAVEN
jgi:N utilization substance protein A